MSLVAPASTHSKAVILLLLLFHCVCCCSHCLWKFSVWSLSGDVVLEYCNILDEEERAGCSNLIVLLLSCGCLCSVSLPSGAVDWSVVVAFPGHSMQAPR